MIEDLVTAVEFTPELVYCYLKRRGTGSRMFYALLVVAISSMYLIGSFLMAYYEGVVGQVNRQSGSVDIGEFASRSEVALAEFFALLWIPLALIFGLAVLWAREKERRAMQEAILEMARR